MTTQVIETKRQPPLWKVKTDRRIRAIFHGLSARAQAEAYAAEHHGEFTVQAKPETGKQVRRAEKLVKLAAEKEFGPS